MKKVMLGILIVIPVIILLAVSLVSIFVSQSAYIAVDGIELDKKSINIDQIGKHYKIADLVKASVYPDRASDKSFVWSLEIDATYSSQELPVALLFDNQTDTQAVEECQENGYLLVNDYASFWLVAKAEGHSARCLVNVVGLAAEYVEIDGEEERSMTVGESVLLANLVKPIDAIVDDTIWTSTNENVAIVDENGVLTAVGAGEAEITVKVNVYEKEGEYIESAPVRIVVSSAATSFGNSITIHGSSVSLESLGLSVDNVILGSNVSILDGVITVTNSANPATILVGGSNGTVVTVKCCQENDIKFENGEFFAYDERRDENFVLAVGEALVLSVGWLSDLRLDAPQGVEYSVSGGAATIENGRLIGMSGGLVTVTASFEGRTASLTVNVQPKVPVLILSTTNKSLAVGIAQETVLGSSTYDENLNLINNRFEVGIMRPVAPEENASESEKNLFYSAFNFVVTENGEATNKAYFEGNVLVFDRLNVTEMTTLRVTVSAKYPKFNSAPEYTTASFDVKVVNGVAVSNYKELEKAAGDKHVVCFDGDIVRFDGETDPSKINKNTSLYFYNDVYGNYHLYRGVKEQYGGTNDALIRIESSDVLISNIRLRVCDVEKEITNAEGTQGLTGIGIVVNHTGKGAEHFTNNRLEYSIVENGGLCMRVYATDFTIDGCILRNTSETGIYCQAAIFDDGSVLYTKLKLNNVIMSNMLGTSMSMHFSGFSNSSAESKQRAQQASDEGKTLIIEQTGFLDIYNWQATNVLGLIPVGAVDDAIADVLNTVIREEVSKNPKFKEFSVSAGGLDYFHLGFLSTGITEATYLKTSFEDERISQLNSSDILSFNLGEPVLVFTYGKNFGNIGPESPTYKVNGRLFSHLRGEL